MSTPSLDPPVATIEAPTGWVRAELAGRFGAVMPDLGVAKAFSLPRARVEAAAAREAFALRAAVVAVRSGGESGYIGLDGESLVPAVQVAEARVTQRAWTFAAGVIDDPWVRSGDGAWGLRDVAPGIGEENGWMDASDVGAWAGWRSPRVRVRLLATSGEGARMRERDESKDVAGYVEAVPAEDIPGALRVAAFARAGTRGLGSARDHRAGVRVAGAVGAVSLGVEALAAWGVGGDATRTPVSSSAWMVARPGRHALGWLRVDAAAEAPWSAEARTLTARAGFGSELGESRAARIVAGGVLRSVGSGVRAVAGAGVLASSAEAFLQLEVTLDTRDLDARDPLP